MSLVSSTSSLRCYPHKWYLRHATLEMIRLWILESWIHEMLSRQEAHEVVSHSYSNTHSPKNQLLMQKLQHLTEQWSLRCLRTETGKQPTVIWCHVPFGSLIGAKWCKHHLWIKHKVSTCGHQPPWKPSGFSPGAPHWSQATAWRLGGTPCSLPCVSSVCERVGLGLVLMTEVRSVQHKQAFNWPRDLMMCRAWGGFPIITLWSCEFKVLTSPLLHGPQHTILGTLWHAPKESHHMQNKLEWQDPLAPRLTAGLFQSILDSSRIFTTLSVRWFVLPTILTGHHVELAQGKTRARWYPGGILRLTAWRRPLAFLNLGFRVLGRRGIRPRFRFSTIVWRLGRARIRSFKPLHGAAWLPREHTEKKRLYTSKNN